MLRKNYKIICNLVCAVLMFALLVLQFLPGYWNCQKDKPDKNGVYQSESASLQGYMWTPSEFKLFDDYFEDLYGKQFELNHVVMMPVATLAFGVLGIVLALAQRRKKLGSTFGILVGAIGAQGYLGHPIFQLNPIWVVHVALCVLMVVVGLVPVVVGIIEKWSAHKKKTRAAAV